MGINFIQLADFFPLPLAEHSVPQRGTPLTPSADTPGETQYWQYEIIQQSTKHPCFQPELLKHVRKVTLCSVSL